MGPSLVGGVALLVIVMGRGGFRGRATVAGVDLGTTNSVICVQAPSGGVGEIECIVDPASGSAVVPSVVSFYDRHHLTSHFVSKKDQERLEPLPPTMLDPTLPHPVDVLVGQKAKERIASHPHHTLYHAKRIIGRGVDHASVATLRREVEFDVVEAPSELAADAAAFRVPYHLPAATASYRRSPDASAAEHDDHLSNSPSAILSPPRVGSYVLRYLRHIARTHLGHGNVRSAVVCVPAKFNAAQRDETIRAFELAGFSVARVIEEPAAAALAYGLHKRDDVRHVMVYDFGGGTLDVSVLYMGDGGYIDVLGSDGDEALGGADFDAAVAHRLLDRREDDDGWNDETTAKTRKAVRWVAEAMRAIGERLRAESGGVDAMGEEVEDLLEEECPVLKKTPLCTLSSLHTLGERMKITLSDHENRDDPDAARADETCLGLIAGPDGDAGYVPDTVEELCSRIRPVSLSLTLREYDEAVAPLYRRALVPVRRLLDDLTMKREEVDEVVMVGGTTRMPQIRVLMSREMEKDNLNTHIDPDLTIAYGAASVID